MTSEAIALRTRRLYAIMAGTSTVPTVVVDIIAHLVHRVEDLEMQLGGHGVLGEGLVSEDDKADTGGLNR